MPGGPLEPTSVYQYFDERGHLLYVGVTGRGHKRLEEHVKTKPWWPQVYGCTIQHMSNRDAALAREKELIQLFRPAHNTVHNPTPVPAFGHGAKTRKVSPEPESSADRCGVKERRRQWYAMSAEDRRTAMCVECGQQPGVGGPSCPTCFAARRARKQRHQADPLTR